jgi:hypothetical protein
MYFSFREQGYTARIYQEWLLEQERAAATKLKNSQGPAALQAPHGSLAPVRGAVV